MYPGPNPLRLAGLVVLILLAGLTIACRQAMADDPKYKPLEPSSFFADGRSARPLVADTVARGQADADAPFATGKVDGEDATAFPFPVTQAVLERGEERFNIYCAPCHSRVGDGGGIIVRRGFTPPPSFHADRLRQAPVGHYYDVITNGFGAMPPYRNQIPPEDRWAIIAYIRALQLSQNATPMDVPPDERARLEAEGGAR